MADPAAPPNPWSPPGVDPGVSLPRATADGVTFRIDARRGRAVWTAHARPVWPAALHPVLLASPALLAPAATIPLALHDPKLWAFVAAFGCLAASWMGTAWGRLAALRATPGTRMHGRTATVRVTPTCLRWEAGGVGLDLAWSSVRRVTRHADTLVVWGPLQASLLLDLKGAPPGAVDHLAATLEELRRSSVGPEAPAEGVSVLVRPWSRTALAVRVSALALSGPLGAVVAGLAGVFLALGWTSGRAAIPAAGVAALFALVAWFGLRVVLVPWTRLPTRVVVDGRGCLVTASPDQLTLSVPLHGARVRGRGTEAWILTDHSVVFLAPARVVEGDFETFVRAVQAASDG